MISEFDAFRTYDRLGVGRPIPKGWRGIHEKLIASERGHDYYFGDRKYGFGGYHDTGLWKPVARDLISHYGLTASSSVLQVGCDFAFLLTALASECPGIRLSGMDPSLFALSQVPESMKHCVIHMCAGELPFSDGAFDLVLCPGLVYTLDLRGARNLIQEIQRVGRRNRYLTLATYESAEDLIAFKEWTLLGQTILTKAEWLELLEGCGYSGDVSFTSARTLGVKVHDQ